MSKHTPGPWSYSVYKDSNHCKIYLHGLGREDKIAGADSLQGYCGEANARLIAAAPLLYEAMQKAVDEEGIDDLGQLSIGTSNTAAILTALKIARGEE